MIGYMANNVLPLRAGEVVRAYVVARRVRAARGVSDAFWLVTGTMVVERVLDSLALVLILAALVLVIPVPHFLEWAAAAVLAIDLASVALLIAIARRPDVSRRLLARLTRRWPALERATVGVFDAALRGLEGIRAGAHLAPMLAWTVVVWLLPALASWAMLRAVHLELPFVAGWTVLAFVGLGISVPSAPGYVGVFHAAAALALGVFGAPPAAAVAYGVLYHASQFVPITLVGWVFLLREQLSLGEAARGRQAAAT